MENDFALQFAKIKRLIPVPIIAHCKQVFFWLKQRQLINADSLSQAGQDRWVYAEAYNEARNKFFVDLGAHDGISISNTFILEKRYHWSGICIEANPRTFYFLQRNRSCSCVNVCVDEKPGTASFALRGVMGGIISNECDNTIEDRVNSIMIQTVRLDELLRNAHAPSTIDYLSIDIEGAEDRALSSFPFDEYTFNCITIERPSEKLRKILHENGYLLAKEVPGLDCFYIHRTFQSTYEDNQAKFRAKGHRD